MATDAVKLWSVAATVARVVRILGDTNRLEPLGAAIENLCHAGHRLNVVDDCRSAKGTFDSWEWWFDPRPSSFAFEAFDQPGFFAADVGACAAMQVHIEAIVGAQECSCPTNCWHTSRR